MTQRREIETRLALYDDLSGILGAMRSFALAELRQVMRREEAQQQLVGALADALGDLAFALPPPVATARDVWLLFGSARGFCGSFNEDVVSAWRSAGDGTLPAVAVGERLQGLIPGGTPIRPVAGGTGALDASATIDRILAAVTEAKSGGAGETGLMACYRDEAGPRTQRLLPLPVIAANLCRDPPLTYEPPARAATGIAEHYLFHALLALLLRSVKVENHMRLIQMENALRHLDERRVDIQRQRNRLRQEEIVEEIELMVRGGMGAR